MIRTVKSMLYVTASLLESWRYCLKNQDTFDEFIKVLKKEKKESNEVMERGVEFEQNVINGNDPEFSEIVDGGAYQFYGKKVIDVDGEKIMILGYLDVLKDSVIYDIKRPIQYKCGKYYDSFQKDVYFELVPKAKEFIFLVFDGFEHYQEKYFREDRRNVSNIVSLFFEWLKQNSLFDVYEKNWRK